MTLAELGSLLATGAGAGLTIGAASRVVKDVLTGEPIYGQSVNPDYRAPESDVTYGASKCIDPVHNGMSAGYVKERMLKPVRIPMEIKTKRLRRNFEEYKHMFDKTIKLTQQFALSKRSDLGKRGFFFMNFRHDYYWKEAANSNCRDHIFPNGGKIETGNQDNASWSFLTPKASLKTYEGDVETIVNTPLHAVPDGQTLLSGMNKCFLAETSYRLSPEVVRLNWSGETAPRVLDFDKHWAEYIERPSSLWRGGMMRPSSSDAVLFGIGGNYDEDVHQAIANRNEPYSIRNDGGKIMLNFSNQGESQCVIDIVVYKAKENYIPKVKSLRQTEDDPSVNSDDISKEIYQTQLTAMRNWIYTNKMGKWINTDDDTFYGEGMDGMGGHTFQYDAGFTDPRMKFIPKLKGFEKVSTQAVDLYNSTGPPSNDYYIKNQDHCMHKEIGRISITLDIGERRKVIIPLRNYSVNCAEEGVPSMYETIQDSTGLSRLHYLNCQERDGLWPDENICLAIGQRGVEIPVAPPQNGNTQSSSSREYLACGLQAAPSACMITGEYVENVHSMMREEQIKVPYYGQNLQKSTLTTAGNLVGVRRLGLEQVVRRPMDFGAVEAGTTLGLTS